MTGRRLGGADGSCAVVASMTWLACALLLPLPLQAQTPASNVVPYADYHQHLFSPDRAKDVYEPPLPAVSVPPPFASLLRERERSWNDTTALAALFAPDAVMLNTEDEDQPSWIRGARPIARELALYFTRAYRIVPVAFDRSASGGTIAGYYARGEGDTMRRIGHVLLSLRQERGRWRIAAEAPTFPGPPTRRPIGAAEVVAQLDDAGMRKAVVLSVAYQWGSAFRAPSPHEYARVRAENDYVAREIAPHRDRLVAFGSFNPLKPYALQEMARCVDSLGLAGIKLHLGNSGVDVRRPEHAAKLREVFRAANARRVPIVIHLWTEPAFEQEGGQHARVILEQVLPEAPDVPIQIAHMAGGGRSTDSALAVFAEAIAANDPRTRGLWFDVATLTQGQTAAGLRQDAMRMRQIGLDRILYGTDSSPPSPAARISWGQFRGLMPLSDEEFRTIATNVAPYVR